MSLIKRTVVRVDELFDVRSILMSLIAGLALLFAADAFAQQPATIKIDGSSTVFPITEAMAEEFQVAQKKVRVTVGISGTGGGFKKFCRAETDLQNASRPISKTEMEACRAAGVKYFELPVAYDAAVIVVNPKNTWLTEVTVADLKKMWAPEAQGKINTWKQVNAKWPDEKFKLYGAGADSGTFDYFTEAIVGKAKSSRGDYTASEDDNTLVTGVANDKNAIGYIPLAYYMENKAKLKAIAVVGGEGAPVKTAVMPSDDTVKNGTYYPLSRPLFIYVSESSYKKPEVKEFAEFYMSQASKLVPSVKAVALPEAAYKLAMDHLKKSKLGTKFGGEPQIGMKIEDLLKKEGKM